MPLLDVSLVLDDPMFQTSFVIKRVTETVLSNGIADKVETLINAVGVVVPDQGYLLERNADYRDVGGTITIYSRERLNASDNTERDADQVIWNAREYTVKRVDDFSEFGQGYTMAQAEVLGDA